MLQSPRQYPLSRVTQVTFQYEDFTKDEDEEGYEDVEDDEEGYG